MFSKSSKTKHSKSHSHRSPSQPSRQEEGSVSTPAPTKTSFLFTTFELNVNEDPANGGVLAQYTVDGEDWRPPVKSRGFEVPRQGRMYRWEDGLISEDPNCGWWEEAWWSQSTEIPSQPREYRSTSMFWCSPFARFRTSNGNATTRNIDEHETEDRWFTLSFRHDEALSRFDNLCESNLAGNNRSWIEPLGLKAYQPKKGPKSTGLAGNLATLIGLIGFSCPEDQLYNVLIVDKAWRNHKWKNHGRGPGRTAKRGILAVVYFDPANEAGSTWESLSSLEWDGEGLIR